MCFLVLGIQEGQVRPFKLALMHIRPTGNLTVSGLLGGLVAPEMLAAPDSVFGFVHFSIADDAPLAT